MDLSTVTALEDVVRPFGSDATVTFAGERGDGEEVSYDQLASDARGAAADLRRRGVEPGDEVAIALGSTRADVTAAMAVWQAGATLMSIPPPPRGRYETYRRGFGSLLKRESCKVVLGRPKLRDALGDDVEVTEASDLDPGCDAPLDDDVAVPDDALIQFTSGSTGSPKGIVIRAEALAGHLNAIGNCLEIDEGDRVTSWLPLYHDMGLVGCTLVSLAMRLPLTLVAPRSFARNPLSWPRMLAEGGGTITAAPNFAYRIAAKTLRQSSEVGDLSAVRVCLSGGERVSYSALEEFAEAAGEHGFRREALLPAYGMAEATLAVSFPPLGRGPVEGPKDSASCGSPLPGVEVRLRPMEGGDEDEGMVELRGPWTFDGYLTLDGSLERRSPESWHATNDVAMERDGELYVYGRADEVVVVRGQNVYAEDIESVALTVPDEEPLAAAAYRSPEHDDRFGLALEVMGEVDDATELARAVQDGIVEALETKVSPVLVVQPLSIPRTTSGKVKRAECRDLEESDGWPDEKLIASVE